MIEVFTQGKPDEKIKQFAAEIFKLKPGAYNLPQPNNPLFEKLYKIGVRQIIHDGKPDEIQAMDGYLYALNSAGGKQTDEKDVLRIKLET